MLEVDELTVIAVPDSAVVPKSTTEPEEKLVPIMVAILPPASGDEPGLIDEIAGIVELDDV